MAAGCADRTDRAAAIEQRGVRVTCTTGMVADLAREVGGARARVTALMGPGVNPHLYKASGGDISRLVGADLVLYSGLHLEGRTTEIFEALAKRKPVVAVTRDIGHERLLTMPDGPYHDPHVWFDVSLWSMTVAPVGAALAAVDPAHADEYRSRAAGYEARLRGLHDWCLARAGELSKEARVLVTSHDAYNYFGRAYGFEVIGVQGISTEEQATSRAIVDLSLLIRRRQIKALFTESSVSPKAVRAVLEDCRRSGWQVREGGELFSDALDEPGRPAGTYAGMVRYNMDIIVNALK